VQQGDRSPHVARQARAHGGAMHTSFAAMAVSKPSSPA
jgi:hypothetical protein